MTPDVPDVGSHVQAAVAVVKQESAMKYLTHPIILAALITPGITAQTPPAQPVDAERLGPQVGEVVRDFSAVDQFGRTQTLTSILGPNGVMLFFNRSADW